MYDKHVITIIQERLQKPANYLAEQQKLIEQLINATPSGDLRNKLTEINILGSLANVELTNF